MSNPIELDLTGCSEREAALVNALKEYNDVWFFASPDEVRHNPLFIDILKACQAYIKKPEPVPLLPAWEELTEAKRIRIHDALPTISGATTERVYNHIRRLTAVIPGGGND